MERLDTYLDSQETKNCYLDGRYFNLVFADYPGLIHNPMRISIKKHRDEEKIYINMNATNLNTSFVGLLKLVIDVDDHKHTNLILLDYKDRKAYRFEPLGYIGPHFNKVNEMVDEYLDFYLGMDLELINIPLSEYDDTLDIKNPRCAKSGFCNAYVIMYAYAYLRRKAFDPKNILKFAGRVEEVYGPLPQGFEEIEYGYHHGHPYRSDTGYTGVLLGGLLLGSALAASSPRYGYYPYLHY